MRIRDLTACLSGAEYRRAWIQRARLARKYAGAGTARRRSTHTTTHLLVTPAIESLNASAPPSLRSDASQQELQFNHRGTTMPAERSRHISRREMLRSLAAGVSALSIAPLNGAWGEGGPEAESGVPTAVLPEAPAATSTPQRTITVWYNNVSINQTIGAFKRANPAIDVDVKLFYDA